MLFRSVMVIGREPGVDVLLNDLGVSRRHAQLSLLDGGSGTDGVYGSCFSGGGYGGCVVALVHGASAENICGGIAEIFSARHPELPSRVFVAETGDGLR